MGVLEICAVVLALIYVILAIFQRRLCWIAAIASASLYIVIFWQVQLYLEAALQVFTSPWQFMDGLPGNKKLINLKPQSAPGRRSNTRWPAVRLSSSVC